MSCECFIVFSNIGLPLAPSTILFGPELTQIKYEPYFRRMYSAIVKYAVVNLDEHIHFGFHLKFLIRKYIMGNTTC